MKFAVLIVAVIVPLCCAQSLKNYTGTELQKCLNCLCHARSGCWSRFNCARYSISFDYWQQAGSPSVSADAQDAQRNYQDCMKNENCIYAAIDQYTLLFGQLDCNCDNKFDCKDRLAIHLFGGDCFSPEYGVIAASRFNHCAAQVGVAEMLSKEGREDCQVEIF